MKFLKVLTPFLLTAFLLAGCSDSSNVNNEPDPPDSKVEIHDNFAVNYTFSGTIAGVHNELSVDKDKRVTYTTLSKTYSHTLTDEEFESLVNVFIDNNFLDLANEYTPETPIADGTTEILIYINGENSKTVTVSIAENIPEGFTKIVVEIGAIIIKIITQQ